MAISHICGFEMGSTSEALLINGTISVQTSIVHSGTYALRCNSASVAAANVRFGARSAGGTQRTIYKSCQFYIRVASLPSVAADICQILNSTPATQNSLRLNTDGTLSLLNTARSVVATTVNTITADGLWHRIDYDNGYNAGSGTRCSIDGGVWTASDAAAIATGPFSVIGVTSAIGDVYFDDVVWHDSALPTILRGYNINLLKPASLSAAGGWTSNVTAGSPTPTHVDNIPPVGSTDTATPGSRIKNVVSSATDNIDYVCETYNSVAVSYTDGAMSESFTTTVGSVSVNVNGSTVSPNNEKIGQSFAWTGGKITSVDLYGLAINGSPVDSVAVSIQADSSGSPSGVDLTSIETVLGSTLPSTAIAPYIATRFTFATTAILASGTYWILVKRTGAADTTNFYKLHQESNVAADYTGGTLKVFRSGTTWSTQSADIHFTATGIPPTYGTVFAVQSICNDAQAITTGSPKAGAVVITANPSGQSEQSFDFGLPNNTNGTTTANAMGTYPTGWGTHVGPVTESPSVTLSTGPTVRVGKRTATTREVDVDFMGVYFMWGTPPIFMNRNLITEIAKFRSSTW